MPDKKIIVLIGSPRKKETYSIVRQFEDKLKKSIKLSFEYLLLKEYNIKQCKGCFICLYKGEEFCPLKDDRDLIIDKLKNSDGLIIATPNYSLQVTALLKNFLDRIAFVFHMPCFFNKIFTSIVTQGAYGGKDIVIYLNYVGMMTGFNTVKVIYLTTLDEKEKTNEDVRIIEKKLEKFKRVFQKKILDDHHKNPSFFQLAIFRMVRSMYIHDINKDKIDYHYFKDNGWFESDYYYRVKLGIIKKIFGKLLDHLAK